jgi:hypothetical protein
MKISEMAIPKIFMQIAVLAALGFICFCVFEIAETNKSLKYAVERNIYAMHHKVDEIRNSSVELHKSVVGIEAKLNDIYGAIPNKDPMHLMLKRHTTPAPLPLLPLK